MPVGSAMWRYVWVVCLFVMLSASNGAAQRNQLKPECSGKVISETFSPMKAMIAVVHEDICSDGAFVTTMTASVRLQYNRHSGQNGRDVLAIDSNGRSENRPKVRWMSNQLLQITIPNKALIGLRVSRYDSVNVVIKFDHNDSAGRRKFLKQFDAKPK